MLTEDHFTLSEGAEHNNPRFLACKYCRALSLCEFSSGEGRQSKNDRKIIKRHRKIRRGEFPYRAGDPFHSICVICSGAVKTYALNRDGSVQITGFHISGELMGLNAVNTKQHTCDAVALENTYICEILYSHLQELCDESFIARRLIFRILGDQIAHDQMVLMPLIGAKSATQKLAAYLLSLSQRFERRGLSTDEFRLSMSRGDLGNYLGLAKETVSRLFSRFVDEGLITLKARHIRINDRKRLTLMATKAPSV